MIASKKWDDDEVVQRFRRYLQIPSVHPDIDYGPCVEFLRGQAEEIGLEFRVIEKVPKKPVVLLTLEGTQPGLASLMFNSHMDVVPVYEDKWTFPPFEACISEDGWIYARGTQDIKGLGMVWLEAVRRLKQSSLRLKRTIHITFVPDEEIGGLEGMKVFTESPEFKELNIGFVMDESAPHRMPDHLIAFNGEKTCRQIKITCRGQPGHGSLLFADTAGEKIHYIINKFMTLRAQELKKVQGGAWFGDVLSINLTQLEGGVQANVIPENLSVSFDIRIPPSIDHEEFDAMIGTWCKEAGENVTFEYYRKNPQVPPTSIDGSVSYWNVIEKVVKGFNMTLECKTCPGATDARYARMQNIPAINLTPFHDTPTLLHDHDERIHVNTFKKGIDIGTKLIHELGDHV